MSLTLAEVMAIGIMKGLEVALRALIEHPMTEPDQASQSRPLMIEAQHASTVMYAEALAGHAPRPKDLVAYGAPVDQAVNLVLRVCALAPPELTGAFCRSVLGGVVSAIALHLPSRRAPDALDKAVTEWWTIMKAMAEALGEAQAAAYEPAGALERMNALLTHGTAIGWRFRRIAYVRRPDTPPAPFD